jgi:hypothetical protein
MAATPGASIRRTLGKGMETGYLNLAKGLPDCPVRPV